MKTKSYFSFDIIIFFSTLALVVIGILFIYSSGLSSTGENTSNEYIKQIIWAVLGLGLLFGVLATDYAIFRNIALYLYAGSILLLVITLLFGKTVNGAKSWLGFFDFGIQPSEFTKISTILMLAWYLELQNKEITSIKTLLTAIGIAALPAGLIIVQPDMGTALVYVPIFLTMIFFAGAKKRYFYYILLLIFLTLFITLFPSWQKFIYKNDILLIQILDEYRIFMVLITGLIILIAGFGLLYLKRRYFYWIIYFFSNIGVSLLASLGVQKFLKDYQLMRLIVFLDPNIDPRGTGWNINQSVTAVGSGGMQGKGFLQGTQSHYKFLPQQSTDFIFSIIAEELGFIGSALIMLLFLIIIIRIYMILFTVKDKFSLNICTGILAMFTFHMFINIGMAIGIMPITGIPLFFLSYGGSSLWTALISIGLILNVYLRRYKY